MISVRIIMMLDFALGLALFSLGFTLGAILMMIFGALDSNPE